MPSEAMGDIHRGGRRGFLEGGASSTATYAPSLSLVSRCSKLDRL